MTQNPKVEDSLKMLQNIGIFNTEDSVYKDHPKSRLFDNVNLPLQFLTQLTPYKTKQLLQATTAEKIVGSMVKILDWEKQLSQVPYISFSGRVQKYDDFSAPTTASVRYDFENMGHYRLSIGLAWGKLEALQFGTTGLDLYNEKMEVCVMLLKQAMNRLFWFGHQVGNTPSINDIQGILTSRYLNAEVTLTTKIGGAGYNYEKAYSFFADIYNYFVKVCKGYSVDEATINVGLSTAAYTTMNSLYVFQGGFSVSRLIQMVESTFPIKVHLCPELDKAGTDGKDMAVAVINRLPNALSETAILGYSELALTSDITQIGDSYYGKLSAGCCGFIPLYPMGVLRYKDVVAS